MALLGSLLTEKTLPKDVDVLVGINDRIDLDALARLGRRLKGTAGSRLNSGADIFLAGPAGEYLGRICHYRECHRRVRCPARQHSSVGPVAPEEPEMRPSDATMTGMMVLFVCAGLLIVGTAVPLILRRVKPNRWYGLRTEKTLADERVWYAANAYHGRLSVGLGAILAVASATLRFVPGIRTSLATYGVVSGALFTVGILVVEALSRRHAEEL